MQCYLFSTCLNILYLFIYTFLFGVIKSNKWMCVCLSLCCFCYCFLLLFVFFNYVQTWCCSIKITLRNLIYEYIAHNLCFFVTTYIIPINTCSLYSTSVRNECVCIYIKKKLLCNLLAHDMHKLFTS